MLGKYSVFTEDFDRQEVSRSVAYYLETFGHLNHPGWQRVQITDKVLAIIKLARQIKDVREQLEFVDRLLERTTAARNEQVDLFLDYVATPENLHLIVGDIVAERMFIHNKLDRFQIEKSQIIAFMGALQHRLKGVRLFLISKHNLDLFPPGNRAIAIAHRYLLMTSEGEGVTNQNAQTLLTHYGRPDNNGRKLYDVFRGTTDVESLRSHRNYEKDMRAAMRLVPWMSKAREMIKRDLGD